jgi:hypothetical protein
MSDNNTIASDLDRLPQAPAAPLPQLGILLMHMDNENDLRRHAQAQAIADHAAHVDADERAAEFSWHIARSAILVKAQAWEGNRWTYRSPDWWAACWRATYCTTRDSLNAGNIPVIHLRDLDAEYREELRQDEADATAQQAHALATAGEFAEFRGGVGPDEPDPYDQY